MVPKTVKIKRFFGGFLLVIFILGGVFSWLPGWIHTYGATETEIHAQYPGDEILQTPVVSWTHAIMINAPLVEVWPWVAQIGDTRGGFYSYTFIENLVAGDDVYHNAAQIIPAFQNPQPGEEIIDTVLPIKEVKEGKYLLAATSDFMGMGWTWLWFLRPEGLEKTRLILRMETQTPQNMQNSIITWFLDTGGFVMEKGMLRGLQERAEGRFMPSPIEPLEGLLWGSLLIVGIVAAWQFVTRVNWKVPFFVGLMSLLGLIVFTFGQPAVLLRIAFIAGLLVFLFYQNRVKPAS